MYTILSFNSYVIYKYKFINEDCFESNFSSFKKSDNKKANSRDCEAFSLGSQYV